MLQANTHHSDSLSNQFLTPNPRIVDNTEQSYLTEYFSCAIKANPIGCVIYSLAKSGQSNKVIACRLMLDVTEIGRQLNFFLEAGFPVHSNDLSGAA